MTRTYATLEVSPAAFREIRDAFIEVGYTHVFETDETKNVIVIDMHGVGLTCNQIEATSGPCPSPGDEDEEALSRLKRGLNTI